MSDNKNKGFKLLGHFYISLLVGIFLVFFLSFTGFLLKAPIQKFYLPLSAALSLFLFCFFTKKDGFKGATLLKALIIYISFVLAAGAVSYFLCDMSWDGRWYHQAGVFLMKLGYNPVFDNDIVKFAKSVYNDTILSACLWVKHYPKFAEIFGANVCLLTGKIETAKIINYLVMYLCAAYSFLTFNNLFKSNSLRLNAFLTALITLTPITICQNATLYVDGLLYYFFIISLFSIVNIELAGNDNRAEQIFHITSLVLSLIMFANVKIACLFYAAFLLFAWFIYLILNKNKNSVFKKFIPVFVIFTLFAALSGANPYFTNIKTGKPVFYPIIGKDKINIFAPPPVLRGKNGFEKLMFSTFASSGNGEKSKYKIPLTISKNEAVFKHADLRISGFGYFWSGIALLTLFLLFKVRINDKNKRKMYALILATLILLFVLNPENWWARYVPWIWAAPVVVCAFSLHCEGGKNKKLAFVILGLMCLNVLIIFCQNFAETLYASYKLEAYTNTIDKSKPVKVYQRENDYTGDCVYLAKLEEKNIKYEFATKEEFEKGCYVPVIKNIDKKLFIECGSYGKIFELNKNKAMD